MSDFRYWFHFKNVIKLKRRNPGFPSAPFPPKSHGKRPIGEVESEVSGNAFATCLNLDGGSPLVSALTRAPVDLRKMFDLLLQLSPPPSGIATLSNEKVAEQLAHHLANVASTGAELFLRCQLTAIGWEKETQSLRATMRDQENQLESRREQISHLDTQLYSLGQYQIPTSFVEMPLLISYLDHPRCPICCDCMGLSQGNKVTAWESVRTVLSEDLTPPGPEPFKKPPTGPSSSRGQDP
nr:uncharacterized protein LOC109149872 [Ipomoea batatas]